MKYYVYAKILGDFLPDDKTIKINNCTIEKDKTYTYYQKDLPQIPINDPSETYHLVQQGVRNFIQYPQEFISVRYFESEYLIWTSLKDEGPYNAIKIANDRFTKTISALSLTLKTTYKKLRTIKIKRTEYYDFEIVGIFIQSKGRLIRVKLPDPLINGHNFFPSPFPNNFIAKAKNILNIKDPVFQKGLSYITEASKMRNSGNVSYLEVSLNFIKCIELISKSVGIPKKQTGQDGKKRYTYTTEYFEMAGKKLRVKKENRDYATQAWFIRNNGDIAHQSMWDWINFPLSYDNLDRAANDYLLSYLRWIKKPTSTPRNTIYYV